MEHSTSPSSTSHVTKKTYEASLTIQSPLFRLPLELRRIIFWQSIFYFKSPTSEQIYAKKLRHCWMDQPSPLLSTSKQTRGEVFDLLQKEDSFTVRLTPRGYTLGTFGLSCVIAQNRMKSLGTLPNLAIEIWPPHPKRRIEMCYLWQHTRNLCTELREARAISKLTIRFVESTLAPWCIDREVQNMLNEGKGFNDLEELLTLFGRINGTREVCMYLPPSLGPNSVVERWAVEVIEAMQRKEVDIEMWILSTSHFPPCERKMKRGKKHGCKLRENTA